MAIVEPIHLSTKIPQAFRDRLEALIPYFWTGATLSDVVREVMEAGVGIIENQYKRGRNESGR